MSLPDTEAETIQRLAHGDEKALVQLYDRYSALVYSVLLRILPRPSDAQEVLEDTWVQVWQTAATFDRSHGTFSAWVLTIARARAIERMRSPDQANEALESLGASERRAIELAYFGCLSPVQIAERLDSSLDTVKSWMRSGLLRLRDAAAPARGVLGPGGATDHMNSTPCWVGNSPASSATTQGGLE